MKFCIYVIVATITLIARVVEAAVPDLSKCQSYAFKCGGDIYQAGKELGRRRMRTGLSDACDMGSGKYRPMTTEHFKIMKDRISKLNSTNIDAQARKLKCYGYETRKNGSGGRLESFSCYMADGSNYIWKKPNKKTPTKQLNTMKTCTKSKQYFTSHDPYLKAWMPCDPSSETYLCEPGSNCVAKVQGKNKKYTCLPDPMRDHECCISQGFTGCSPGECCAGSRCDKGTCVEGWEPKSVTDFPGICTDHTVRKTGILQGNLCVLTPDVVDPKNPKKKTQGDCALGLHCHGSKGYGFCKWWDKYKNKCSLEPWKKGCMTGDCQEGTYCKNTYNSNGSVKFTQCVPKPYNFQGVPGDDVHDGLCTGLSKEQRSAQLNALKARSRIYNKKLGKCVGVVGSVWGDPHVISYDNIKWDCQAQGDYVITDNWILKAQGRFDGMPLKNYQVSQSKAFAVQSGHHTPNDVSDDAKFQLWFPEDYVHKKDKEDFNHDIFQRGFLNDCPVAMRFNDEYVTLNVGRDGVVKNGQTFIDSPSLTAKVTNVAKRRGVFMTLDFATGASVEFRIHGGGSKEQNGCVMSIKVCLPGETDPSIAVPYNDTVGLLGFPDGQKSNDWMKMNNGNVTFMEVVLKGADKKKRQWDYCTTNWCIKDKKQSIMPYIDDGSGTTQNLLDSKYYISQCNKGYPGDLDLSFCKSIIPCRNHLPKGKSFDDVMTEGLEFSASFEMCCVECMFGADACEQEEETIVEIETLATDPGIDGDPIDDLPVITCANLGTTLSGTTGPTRFQGVLPPPVCGDEEALIVGEDNSYSLFVGGTLTVKSAEDLEGRVYAGAGIVIENPMANLSEDDESELNEIPDQVQLNGIGYAVCGSHVLPSTLTRVLEVCGSISVSMPEAEQVDIMPLEELVGTIVYSGQYFENGEAVDSTSATLFNTNGEIKRVADTEVCSIKQDTLLPLIAKSTWWASEAFRDYSLGVYGQVQVSEAIITLKQPELEKGCPLIFNIDASIFDQPTSNGDKWRIRFDKSIGTTTVLINILGTTVNLLNLGVMQEEVSCIDAATCIAAEGYAFSTELVSNLLWNFPDATSIKFGESPDIDPFTWEGSILAPKADIVWHYATHRGRLVVGGSLTIDRHDAIFMNYAFDPEACALAQLPDSSCEDIQSTVIEECSISTYIGVDDGKSACPLAEESIVQMTGAAGYPGEMYMDGSGIVFGLVFSPGADTVKFNVNNPFNADSDVYVQHEVFSNGGTTWRESQCDAQFAQSPCLKDSMLGADRQYETACKQMKNGGSYAVIHIHFATKDGAVVDSQLSPDLQPAPIPACCYPPDYKQVEEKYGFVQYSYLVQCSCPSSTPKVATRKLRD